MRPTRRASTKGSVRRWASAAYASRFRRIGLTSTRRRDVSKHTPSGKPRVLKLSGISTTYPRPTSSLTQRPGAPLERGPSPLQSCMITTAGNGPGPSGFDSSTGICSEVPLGVVVVMEGPVSAGAQPATAAHSASALAAVRARRLMAAERERLAARFEELDRALVGLRLAARPERTQVAALARPRVALARIEPVSSGGEPADHRVSPSRERAPPA